MDRYRHEKRNISKMKETKSERNSESEYNSRERETHTQRMRDSEDKK